MLGGPTVLLQGPGEPEPAPACLQGRGPAAAREVGGGGEHVCFGTGTFHHGLARPVAASSLLGLFPPAWNLSAVCGRVRNKEWGNGGFGVGFVDVCPLPPPTLDLPWATWCEVREHTLSKSRRGPSPVGTRGAGREGVREVPCGGVEPYFQQAQGKRGAGGCWR